LKICYALAQKIIALQVRRDDSVALIAQGPELGGSTLVGTVGVGIDFGAGVDEGDVLSSVKFGSYTSYFPGGPPLAETTW